MYNVVGEMIGSKIKELRTMHSMNQRDFAQRVAISQPTLSCYENGTALPSIEVLMNIAIKFGVSLDWLCGMRQDEFSISNLSDFFRVLLQLDKVESLRYEIKIDGAPTKKLESDTDEWQASIIFNGKDHTHPLNADICEFLSALKANRQAFEMYFASKEQYLWWQKYVIDIYSESVLTKKDYEDIPDDRRIYLRNKLAERGVQGSNK